MNKTMTKTECIYSYLSGIRALVSPESKIDLLLNSILLVEIHLKQGLEEQKVLVCKSINELLKLIRGVEKLQMVLAVVNDDNDKYVRLIGEGIEGKELEFPR